MRRKLFPSLKRPGAFSRLNLVLAFSLFQVLEEKIVQEYKKFRKVRIGLGVVAGRVKMDFFFFLTWMLFLFSGTQVIGKKSVAVSTCIRNCPTLKVSSWSLRKRTGAAEAVPSEM